MQMGLELGGYWPTERSDWQNLFPEMMNVVRKADAIGLNAIVVGEHHFMDYGCTPSPLSLITHMASFVSIPRLIAAILMVPIHDAPLLAGEVAQADHLTGGRLEIGPARGGAPYEYDLTGRKGDAETTRRNFEEQFKALRMLLTEENCTFEGEFTRFNNVTIMPPVLRKPHPPIWQPCQREEAAFHCAKNGYHVITSSLRRPMSYVKGLREAFDAGLKEGVRPQGQPEFGHLQWVYVAKDEADLKEKLEIAYKKQRKFWGQWTNSTTHLVVDGKIPEIDTPDTVEDFSKGIIFGTKEQVTERLIEIAELGTDLMVMKTGFGQSNADELASYDRLAEFILPRFQTHKAGAPRAAAQ
jgi:alkanesulfonate monooxygenase SsuD/methylene tetrahydromethanopterin reductase-like flavin-dependent oxidoreductase (luciferase family)